MERKLIILVFLLTKSVFGQVIDYEIKQKDNNGNAKFIKFSETKIDFEKNKIKQFLKSQYKSNNNITFIEKINSRLFTENSKSLKFQQFYKNVKVEFAVINAIGKDDFLNVLNGNYITINNLEIKPKLTESKALSLVLDYINADIYVWDDNVNKISNDKDLEIKKPKAELVIIDSKIESNEILPTLAYKFDVYSLKPISRSHYYIDANNGKILLEDPIIKHITALADTRYSGQKSIETSQVAGNFILKDITRGNGIHTLNMNNGSNYSGAIDLLDNDNNWSNSEYNNLNNKNSLLDAHWAAIMTYDYFLNTHNRNSINNSGYELKNYVNANLVGFGLPNNDNAFWDGSKMTYGSGTVHNPLVTIDIVAHEIGHGLDQFTSNLVYNRESGAIDEGLSDVWGAMVEYYADPSKVTYSLGEDLGFSFRSLSNPKSKGDPDTYGGINWINPNCGTPNSGNDYCGVHTNSGVFNHWFYLLAEGSSSTDEINDNGDVFSISGIGKEKASKIIYRAQVNYFTSLTNFQQAKQYTIQAAEDLYGINSVESATVCGAWYAVGVGSNDCVNNIDLIGSKTICFNNTKTYNLTNSGNAVSWEISSNLQLVSSSNNSITVKPVNTPSVSDFGYVKAILGIGSVNKDIWVGKPHVDYVQFFNDIGGTGYWCSTNYNNDFQFEPNVPNSTYQIRLRKYPNLNIVYSSPTIFSGNSGTLNYYPSTGWYLFEIKVDNICGSSGWVGYEVQYADCLNGGGGGEEGEFFISPNPSKNSFNVTRKEKKSLVNKSNSNKSLFELFDFKGNLLRKGNLDKFTIINTNNLKKGKYLLKIITENNVEVHQLLLE